MFAFLAALIVGSGLLLVVYGINLRGMSRRDSLRQLLEIELAEPTSSPEALSELMEKAGAFADRTIGKTSLAGKMNVMLSQAGWSLRSGEFAAVLLAISVGLAVIATLLTGSVLAGIIAGIAIALAGMSWLGSKGRRRIRRMEQQLPSVLQLLAGSLDSGSSVLLALELAAEEGDPPLAPELKRVVAETRVGSPMIDSLEAMAARIGSHDIEWTVEAIRIQSQTGGKLADTLRVLADFMRTRLEVRGEVKALSAEARLSGKVLTALPLFMAAYMFAFQRTYLEPLFTTGLGKWMIAAAVMGIIFGSLWMRRLVKVEV